MLDAFARVIRKPQQVLGYEPVLTSSQVPPPGTLLRREPDGPVAIKFDTGVNFHVPSPFRIGYKIDWFF
jgi:hypothetical protein